MERKPAALLIMGSVRPGRLCPAITEWVAGIARSCTRIEYEIVDFADWPLPMDDEPAMPAQGPYAQAHTRAWSGKIQSADAVAFVTPQYNWGYPAVLKNAIDHLYHEWRDKPAVIVTYGGHGGSKCAEQLKQVAAAVKLRLVATAPAIVLPAAVIRENAAFVPERDFAEHRTVIERAFVELAELIESVGAA